MSKQKPIPGDIFLLGDCLRILTKDGYEFGSSDGDWIEFSEYSVMKPACTLDHFKNSEDQIYLGNINDIKPMGVKKQ